MFGNFFWITWRQLLLHFPCYYTSITECMQRTGGKWVKTSTQQVKTLACYKLTGQPTQNLSYRKKFDNFFWEVWHQLLLHFPCYSTYLWMHAKHGGQMSQNTLTTGQNVDVPQINGTTHAKFVLPKKVWQLFWGRLSPTFAADPLCQYTHLNACKVRRYYFQYCARVMHIHTHVKTTELAKVNLGIFTGF